jgi:hypothetical protein
MGSPESKSENVSAVSGTVCGAVFFAGTFEYLRLHPEMLICDLPSWVRGKIEGKDGLREQEVEASEEGDDETAVQIACEILELEEWLNNHAHEIRPRSLRAVQHRASFGQATVGKSTIDGYIMGLIRRGFADVMNERDIDRTGHDLDFLFRTDLGTPMLYGTSRITAALRYTGPEIMYQKVASRDEMYVMITALSVALREAAMAAFDDGEIDPASAIKASDMAR